MIQKGLILPLYRLVLLTFTLVSCSSNNQVIIEHDPFEQINRSVFEFNNSVDESISRPVAKAYETYIPVKIQLGVHNFFNNIDDFSVMFNDALQLKFTQSLSDAGRFGINSTIGFFGVIDFATELGFSKHNEDLNQTLGFWGVPDGPFLVIPILGVYNTRSAASLAFENTLFTPLTLIEDTNIRSKLILLDFFDARVHLLLASEILDIASLDAYSYMRESYKQRQRSLIYDGNLPEDEFDELDMLE